MEAKCSNCGITFERNSGDYNRSQRIGRPMFCSLKCSTTYFNRTRLRKPRGQPNRPTVEVVCDVCGKIFQRRAADVKYSISRSKKICCSQDCVSCLRNSLRTTTLDELAPFRYFIRNARSRKRKKGQHNLTAEYLKLLWEEQSGTCPFTGWAMALPIGTVGFEDREPMKHASLDRVDCSKGYVVGNVRYVSFAANVARHNYTDEQLIEFCNAVTKKNPRTTDVGGLVEPLASKPGLLVGLYEPLRA